jgi:ubiquinone/menaquinone biosynthesis C-methylase UbiE
MSESGKSTPAAQRDYLREHLRQVPAFRALVRSVECRLFAQASEQIGGFAEPVLDIGCGDGLFASLAFSQPLFAGIDPNQASLQEAREGDVHQHLLAASATALPFPNQFFKTVVANCVIEHIPNLDGTLSEVFRVLRPGGRFLGVPSHRFADMLLVPTVFRACGLSQLAKAYGDWFNRHSRHFHTYDPQHWERLLAAHEFQVEHWEYYLTAAAHRAFDLAHYLSIPRLVSRKLTGKWVAFPNPVSDFLFESWLRPHYERVPDNEGPYLFFRTRKASLPSGR